jgi:hypothetical protein
MTFKDSHQPDDVFFRTGSQDDLGGGHYYQQGENGISNRKSSGVHRKNPLRLGVEILPYYGVTPITSQFGFCNRQNNYQADLPKAGVNMAN